MHELLGDRAFDQAVKDQELDPDDQALLALLQQDPKRLRAFLVESRLLPRAEADTDAARN